MEEIQCFQKIKRDLEEGEETRLGWVEDCNFGDGFCCREGRGGGRGEEGGGPCKIVSHKVLKG